MLDALLASGGRLVRDTKLATELLAFAGHLEGKLAIDMARESAAGMEMRSEMKLQSNGCCKDPLGVGATLGP
jgi:hypothetical protein